MLPYFTERYGNAASVGHVFGWSALEAVDEARVQVASLIGATPREIVFTSGATESDNLALRGVAAAYRSTGRHIVTTQIEHKAVLDTARQLEAEGVEVTYLRVDAHGRIDLDELEQSLRDDTILVSIMPANNEIGTLQDVAAIGRICRERGVLYHADATQAVGKISVDVRALHIDLMSFTAHKMYGPKGIGALYVSRREPRVAIVPQITGGGHENGRRSGTMNTPGIVGFGKAAQICMAEMADDSAHALLLRDRLQTRLLAVEGSRLNGHPNERLPGTLNVLFDGVEADAVMAAVPNVAISSGAACTSATIAPSHVLKAIGRTDEEAASSLRFSIGRFNTAEEIDRAAECVLSAVRKRRQLTLNTEGMSGPLRYRQ